VSRAWRFHGGFSPCGFSKAVGDYLDPCVGSVVLREPVQPATEIARTGDIVAGLALEHDVVISCVFMDENRYRTRAGPLLRNVRREGIRV
jgi:hypothetical protein